MWVAHYTYIISVDIAFVGWMSAWVDVLQFKYWMYET